MGLGRWFFLHVEVLVVALQVVLKSQMVEHHLALEQEKQEQEKQDEDQKDQGKQDENQKNQEEEEKVEGGVHHCHSHCWMVSIQALPALRSLCC